MATNSRRTVKPKGSAADVLRGIAEKKAVRDQDKLAKQKQEDAALQAYAAAVGAAADAKDAIGKKITRLLQQVEALTEDAKNVEKEHEPDQVAALQTLSNLGQSADDIADVIPGLSAKRVRALLKLAEGIEPAAGADTQPTKPELRLATAKGSDGKAATQKATPDATEAATLPDAVEVAEPVTTAP